MRVANEVAHRYKHPSIDTEHILLALIGDASGVAASVLHGLGLHPAKITLEVEKLVRKGTGTSLRGQLSHTAIAERAIEFAIEEAQELGHNYVGTEHLLLGLLREKAGLAARVLTNFGLDLEAVRSEISRGISRHVEPGGREQFTWSGAPALNDADKEFFLGLYRSSVAYYKPGIEKRTGVRLGDMAVWDYSQLHQDRLEDLKRRVSPRRVGIVRSLVLRRQLRKLWQNSAEAYADKGRKCTAVYFNNAIYVSFGSNTAHEHALAVTTVHELSHALWERLEGRPLHVSPPLNRQLEATELDKFKLLVEGYAAYAERTWFLDLYPAGTRDVLPHARMDPASIHYKGLRKVEELVKQHGSEILLEIPKRWRDF